MFTRRIAAVAVGAAVGVVALAGSAYAHVEVHADPARAQASNAVVSFSAEAESGSAGVASVRVVLPQGIAPADVTLVSGPSGWTLTPTADGFTVAGKALAVHKDVAYSIKVRRLPDAPSVAFKTLVNYANGDVDRWIEVPSASDPNPDNPAPVLRLAAASPTSVAPTNASSTPPAGTASESAAPAVTAPAGSAEPAPTPLAVWVLFIVMAVVAAALAVIFVRRKMAR